MAQLIRKWFKFKFGQHASHGIKKYIHKINIEYRVKASKNDVLNGENRWGLNINLTYVNCTMWPGGEWCAPTVSTPDKKTI